MNFHVYFGENEENNSFDTLALMSLCLLSLYILIALHGFLFIFSLI